MGGGKEKKNANCGACVCVREGREESGRQRDKLSALKRQS